VSLQAPFAIAVCTKIWDVFCPNYSLPNYSVTSCTLCCGLLLSLGDIPVCCVFSPASLTHTHTHTHKHTSSQARVYGFGVVLPLLLCVVNLNTHTHTHTHTHTRTHTHTHICMSADVRFWYSPTDAALRCEPQCASHGQRAPFCGGLSRLWLSGTSPLFSLPVD